VNELYIRLAAVGGLLLVLGLMTSVINHVSFLSEPFLALLAGVLLGPAALCLLELTGLGLQEAILGQERPPEKITFYEAGGTEVNGRPLTLGEQDTDRRR
jgi:hypothetical protein